MVDKSDDHSGQVTAEICVWWDVVSCELNIVTIKVTSSSEKKKKRVKRQFLCKIQMKIIKGQFDAFV